jgi:hypothetical protein
MSRSRLWDQYPRAAKALHRSDVSSRDAFPYSILPLSQWDGKVATLSYESAKAFRVTMEQQELIEKIKRLPQDRIAEIEGFVDSLARREHSLNRINLHQALTNYASHNARERMPTSILTSRPPRPITCSNKTQKNEAASVPEPVL